MIVLVYFSKKTQRTLLLNAVAVSVAVAGVVAVAVAVAVGHLQV